MTGVHNIAGQFNLIRLYFKPIDMESTITNITEPLFEKAGAYAKTSIELMKMKALDKTTDVSASLFSRSLFIVAFSFFLLLFSIAISLWIGESLGKLYYGFLIVSSFYALLGIVLLIIQPSLKGRIANGIARQLYN